VTSTLANTGSELAGELSKVIDDSCWLHPLTSPAVCA